MFPEKQWNENYWPGSYFSKGNKGNIIVDGPVYRDADIFMDIQQRLMESGIFNPTQLHFPADRIRAGNEDGPIVSIRRISSNETEVCCTPITVSRSVRYETAISLRWPEANERGQELERLGGIAANLLTNKSLANITLPPFTTLSGWSADPKARHPEGRIIGVGTFEYLVERN